MKSAAKPTKEQLKQLKGELSRTPGQGVSHRKWAPDSGLANQRKPKMIYASRAECLAAGLCPVCQNEPRGEYVEPGKNCTNQFRAIDTKFGRMKGI